MLADANSPTVRIGSPVMSDFPKVKHTRKMLSLDNAYNVEDVLAFFNGVQAPAGIVEPKIDGLSLALHYQDGRLVKAVTRGDGQTGDDVTTNARAIKSIPLILDFPVTVEVRGEVCMFFDTFNKLNEQLKAAGEDLFANPRNAASGTMKSKDSRVVAQRGLNFVAYNVADPIKFLTTGNRMADPDHTHDNTVKTLVKCGFLTVFNYPANIQNTLRSHFCTSMATESDVVKALAWGEEMRQMAPFPTDGLVFKLDDLKLQAELGDGTKSPKWAVAFKFPPERKPTKLLSIEVSIGRLGTLTPVANLEPVHLSGTTVQRASLCNQDEIDRLGIGVGDMVLVEKSAEIIPKVMGIYKKYSAQTWKMPAHCPSCSHEVTREEGKVAYRCTYHRCEAQVIERLKHALGKSALDWDGMGEVMIKFLVVACEVSQVSDLFAFTDEQITTHLSASAAKKFLTERERVKKAPLWRKIHALGLEGIGRSLSQDLCAKWHSLEEMVDHIDDLRSVLGEVMWENFKEGLMLQADEIDRLQNYEFVFETEAASLGVLSGKVFCITGTMMSGSREEVSQRVEQAGGSVKSSVSKKVNFLVNGPGGGANKAEAARKHGTIVITEQQLYEMLGVPMPTVESKNWEE